MSIRRNSKKDLKVKTKRGLFVFTLSIFFLWSFNAHSALKNYISYDLEYRSFETMRLQLENKLGQSLKNRGEAHVTVITPPEYQVLTRKIKAEQIHFLANAILKESPPYEIVCLGSGAAEIDHKIEKTYYVVVQSEALLKLRQDLAILAQIEKEIFDPNLFFPHVTLGFTGRDLHYEDGVIKDKRSCLK